ncbi:MAG TPA: hypothetical protein PLE24_05030 [Chitinispirillaceae bacterium]|nr:hypothetical protein [Chitinispirillaceae bacterium]
MAIIPDLKPEEMPGKLRDVAIKCGIEDALSLLQHVPGLEIYVPTSGRDIYNYNYIKDNYKGFNALSIGVKLGIDSSKVKSLAKKSKSFSDPLTSVQLRIVETECGKDIANRLLMNFPGERIQVPTNDNFLKRKYIKKFFNGTNGQEIAIKLCVTDRFVRKVVVENYNEKRSLQLSLF